MFKILAVISLCALAASTPAHAVNAPPSIPVDAGVIVDTSARGWIWHGMAVVDDPGFHGGSGYAGGSGTYAAYSFQGTSVAVYAMRGYAVTVDGRAHKMGSLKVKIDGQEKADVALNAGDSQFGYLAYSIGGLENKIHVVQLEADGGWVAVDYLKVGAGIDAPTAPDKTAARYLLINHHSGMAVSISTDGHVIQSTPDPHSPGQMWTMVKDADGRCRFRNDASGRFLSAAPDSQWITGAERSDSAYQVWSIQATPTGFVDIVDAGNGYVLNVFDGSTFAGAWLNANANAGVDTQEWEMRAVASQ